ncbi:MAG TPA: periplasmic heavy metal sensor [Thermoanaerobaculia bacterium]|nr:periplasmic heavy metal sensor [Thermoanaerobaculia bacterium]
MRRKYGLPLLLVSLFLVAIPLAAQAPPPSSGIEHSPIGRLGQCLRILGLDEAQIGAIRSAIETAAPTLRALREQLQADRATLEAQLAEENPDACATGSALLEVVDDRAAIGAELQTLRTTIEAVLSPEQAAKLAGCMEAPGEDRRPRDND